MLVGAASCLRDRAEMSSRESESLKLLRAFDAHRRHAETAIRPLRQGHFKPRPAPKTIVTITSRHRLAFFASAYTRGESGSGIIYADAVKPGSSTRVARRLTASRLKCSTMRRPFNVAVLSLLKYKAARPRRKKCWRSGPLAAV